VPSNRRPGKPAQVKVTGAPAYGSTPARGAMGDWTNRRKELKFAATDLKLYRRDQETAIEHWGVWREQAAPKTYFLWAARLRPEKDSLVRMVAEAQALVNTYLDGAGIFGWEENRAGDGYVPIALPASAQVTELARRAPSHRLGNQPLHRWRPSAAGAGHAGQASGRGREAAAGRVAALA